MKLKYFSLSIVLLLSLIIISSAVVYLLTPFGAATTPDSLNYFDVSHNIRSGKGVVLTNYEYFNKDDYIPLTKWPPLYPIFLSLFSSGVIHDSPIQIRYANIFLIILLTTILFLTIRTITDDLTAFIATLLLIINQAVLTVYTYAWSETLFIPVIILSFTVSIRVIIKDDEKKKGWYYLGIATILAITAFYIRYVAVFIIPSLIFGVFFTQNTLKIKLKKSALITSIFLVGISPLLITYKLLGESFSGTVRPESRFSTTEVVLSFLWEFPRLFIPKNGWILTGIFIMLLGFIVCLGIYSRHAHRWIDNTKELKGIHLSLLGLIWTGSYLFTIILLRTQVEFDSIGVRLLSPVVPFIIFSTALTIKSLFTMSNKILKRLVVSSALLVVMCCVYFGVNLIFIATNNWHSVHMPLYYDSKSIPTLTNFTSMMERSNMNKNSSLLMAKKQIFESINKRENPIVFIFGVPILLDRINLKYDSIYYIDPNNKESMWKLKGDKKLHDNGYVVIFEKKHVLESIKNYYEFNEVMVFKISKPLDGIYAYVFSL